MDVQATRRRNLRGLKPPDTKDKDFAIACGVGESYYSQIMNGHRPFGEKTARKIEEALGIPRFSLDQERQVEYKSVGPGPDIKGLVPLINWVKAGDWAESPDLYEVGDAEKWMACPVSHGDRTFVLRVNGPSMDDGTPDGYPDGHLIYVDPDRGYKKNDDVVVKNGDGKVTFKRLVSQGDDFWLKPLNKGWPEPIIPLDEHCRIIGVVIFSGKER